MHAAKPDFLAKISRNRLLLTVVALLWAFAVGAGSRLILKYSFTPGPSSAASAAWPRDAAIKLRGNKARLVIFAHPQCFCSRATIHELAVIMTRDGNKVDAYVFFIAPASMPREWVRAGLWRAALEIPGVHAVEDFDGLEARRFGALTSGQSMLYDARGNLLFSGGITGSRGHEGPNKGSDAIVSFLEAGTGLIKTAPVFGCSLLDQRSSSARMLPVDDSRGEPASTMGRAMKPWI